MDTEEAIIMYISKFIFQSKYSWFVPIWLKGAVQAELAKILNFLPLMQASRSKYIANEHVFFMFNLRKIRQYS